MKISKEDTKIIKEEYNNLKKLLNTQRKQNKLYVEENCKTILKYCKNEWGYEWEDLLADAEVNVSATLLLSGLKN